MTIDVYRQGGLAHRAGIGTDPVWLALKCNATLGVELHPAQSLLLPAVGGQRERIGGADRGAGHVGAGQAGCPRGLEVGRPRGQATARTHLEDCPRGTDPDALVAAGTSRQEGHFRQRARWAHVTLPYHPFLGDPRRALDGVTEEMAEEGTTGIREVGHAQKIREKERKRERENEGRVRSSLPFSPSLLLS